jgi:hypothetical protein
MLLSVFLGLALQVAAQHVDYSQFVNPFIGSEGAIPGYACKYHPILRESGSVLM